jgi:hypothetical protein
MPYTLPSFTIEPLPFPIVPISIGDLTKATVAGDGVFDILMRANKAHLEQEFLAGRIKGPEYSTVYLGSLQSVLQASIQFLLERDKTALSALMLKQQYILAQVEVMKAAVQLKVLEASLLKIPYEIAILIAQECNLRAEFDNLKQTLLKLIQETALLAQKTQTEKAQVMAMGVDDNSVIGRQKLLYAAQTAGYTRDAEQKAAKMLIETWSVRRGTDEGTVYNMENMLHDSVIGRAVLKVLDGVGA